MTDTNRIRFVGTNQGLEQAQLTELNGNIQIPATLFTETKGPITYNGFWHQRRASRHTQTRDQTRRHARSWKGSGGKGHSVTVYGFEGEAAE